MARRPRPSFGIRSTQIHAAGEPVTWIRTGPDTAVPEQFRAIMDLDDVDAGVVLSVRVNPAGQPRVVGVTVADVDDVTSTILRRLPIDTMLRVAVAAATRTDSP